MANSMTSVSLKFKKILTEVFFKPDISIIGNLLDRVSQDSYHFIKNAVKLTQIGKSKFS